METEKDTLVWKSEDQKNTKWVLHQGDCVEIMRRDWNENSVDLMVTDPPYSAAFVGELWQLFKSYKSRPQKIREGGSEDGKKKERKRKRDKKLFTDASLGGIPGRWSDHFYASNEEYENFTRSWMREAHRVLKPGSFLVMFACVKLIALQIRWAEDSGFVFRDQIIWRHARPAVNKGRTLSRVSGQSHLKAWSSCLASQYEPILVFQKKWQFKRYSPTLQELHREWQTGFVDTSILPSNIIEGVDDNHDSRDNPHYSPKPVDLFVRLIKAFAPSSGDKVVVMDPFAGSGTCLRACRQISLPLQLIAVELERDYCLFALSSLNNTKQQDSSFE